MAFICVSTSSKSLTGPQNNPPASGPDISPPPPPPSPQTITIAPTIDLVTLYRNPSIGYQSSDTIPSNTASIFNPRFYPFGAAYFHYVWRDLEPTQGNYTFDAVLKDLDNAWANGQTANIKVLENDLTSSIDTPSFLYTVAGWEVTYEGLPGHFCDYSNATVRTILGNFLQALFAAIGTHPAFAVIDAGWGAFQENTYSGTAIVSKINTTIGTISFEIPNLTNTVASQYYDVWATYFPPDKQMAFTGDQYSWDYAVGSKHTGGRADSFGYQAPIGVQCTVPAAIGGTYGGQFMCRSNNQTFAANQIIPSPYTPSQPNAYLNGMLALELWAFYYRTFGTGGNNGVVTADATTDEITITFSSSVYSLANGSEVRFYSLGGAVPEPLIEGDDYFVINATTVGLTRVFEVSATSGGSAIDLSTAGTGTIHCIGSTGVDATGSAANRRWEGASWDFASSFQYAIDNHVSLINAKNAFRPKKSWITATDNLLRSIGYRYQLRSFSFPNLATAGNQVTFSSTWRNVGNAPNYRNTVIGYRLKNAATNEMFYLTNNTPLNYNAYSVIGDVPLSELVTIPNYVDDGSYEISVAGMDPVRKVGELKLALVSPADDGGRWYPMGVMSIASPFSVSPSPPTTYSARFVGTAKYGSLTDRESFHLSRNKVHAFLSTTVLTDFSIFMRVKTNSISATQGLLCKGDIANAANFEWGIIYSNGFSCLQAAVSDGTNVQRASWSSNAVVGETYNIYAEYDKATREISISVDNGTDVVATALATDVTITSQAVRLGSDNANRHATADIRYAYTWKKKLSADARTALHNSGLGLALSDFDDELKDQLYSAYNFTNQNLNDEWNINHFTNVGGVTFV